MAATMYRAHLLHIFARLADGLCEQAVIEAQLCGLMQAVGRFLRSAQQLERTVLGQWLPRRRQIEAHVRQHRPLAAGVPKALDPVGECFDPFRVMARCEPPVVLLRSAPHPGAIGPSADQDARSATGLGPWREIGAADLLAVTQLAYDRQIL